VGLCQKVKLNINVYYPKQNSLNRNKRTPVRNKLYSKYKIEHPLCKGRHPQKYQLTSQQTGTYVQKETEKMLDFRLAKHLR